MFKVQYSPNITIRVCESFTLDMLCVFFSGTGGDLNKKTFLALIQWYTLHSLFIASYSTQIENSHS